MQRDGVDELMVSNCQTSIQFNQKANTCFLIKKIVINGGRL